MIYTAATDGKDQLRYPAGEDSIAKDAKRKAEIDEAFLADMRRQFSLGSNRFGFSSRSSNPDIFHD